MSTVMIGLMRRQAVLRPAGCDAPRRSKSSITLLRLVVFGMPEGRIPWIPIPTGNSLSDAIRRGTDWALYLVYPCSAGNSQ